MPQVHAHEQHGGTARWMGVCCAAVAPLCCLALLAARPQTYRRHRTAVALLLYELPVLVAQLVDLVGGVLCGLGVRECG
jgi:hypothetical protein